MHILITLCLLILVSSQNSLLRKLSDKTSINCTTGSNTFACSYHGICSGDFTCVCDTGYITFPTDSKFGCNYQQKSALIAFLLEFFLGVEVGAGELYLGNISLGIGQLIFFWVGLLFFISFCTLLAYLFLSTDEAKYMLYGNKIGTFIWSIGVTIFWIVLIVYIVNGTTVDGNGAPITPI